MVEFVVCGINVSANKSTTDLRQRKRKEWIIMQEKIMEILVDINEEIANLGQEENLIALDMIDSFGIVSLISELENCFDIEFNAMDITVENFETIFKIIQLVEKKIQSK